MSDRAYLDFAERIERDADEQLVCELLGEYIARRHRHRMVEIADLLDAADAAGPTPLAALSSAIAFYEHALDNHPTAC